MFCKHPRGKRVVKSEKDRCSWVECGRCGARGPKKHSKIEAIQRFKQMGFQTIIIQAGHEGYAIDIDPPPTLN